MKHCSWLRTPLAQERIEHVPFLYGTRVALSIQQLSTLNCFTLCSHKTFSFAHAHDIMQLYHSVSLQSVNSHYTLCNDCNARVYQVPLDGQGHFARVRPRDGRVCRERSNGEVPCRYAALDSTHLFVCLFTYFFAIAVLFTSPNLLAC